MPDGGNAASMTASRPPARRRRRLRLRLVPPLLRRILLVNAMPLVLLLASLLYLDQYQDGLLMAEVGTLREQARIYAGALGETAVRDDKAGHPFLVPDLARPLLRRLTEPTPSAQAKVYAPDGALVADSRVRQDKAGKEVTEPLPPAAEQGPLLFLIGRVYDWVQALLPHQNPNVLLNPGPSAGGTNWQPDVKEEVRLAGSNQSREMPPYIRRTEDNRLLITVAEPVQRDRITIGIVLLTREAREVDSSLLAVRLSILGLFALALGLTVMLSSYLSQTIARPILRLAAAADRMREGRGRTGVVPAPLLRRRDEIGELAEALSESARALWDRMDAIERFAADVAHEIKNPLSSIRSAIETLRLIEDPEKRRHLLAIITEDVGRLDRLISDISDSSRVDAELSRAATEPVDVIPILKTLAEINEATRGETDPRFELVLPPVERLVVQAVESRLVQVLRNLIGNATSFSPPAGRIWLGARATGGMIEISVEDEGPGIPEARLEHIFDRFYSERPRGEHFGQHSGLGLSISRQIVEALRGRIVAENRRDASGTTIGARFIVSLPRAAES